MMIRRKKFVKILRIELEDLQEHIEGLVAQYEKSQTRHEMTERVCFENIAVLRSEEGGIHGFLKILDSLNLDDYDDLDALVADVKARFRERIRACGFVPAAYVFAEAKIDKVHRYVAACSTDVPNLASPLKRAG